jgi:hypothetical protein
MTRRRVPSLQWSTQERCCICVQRIHCFTLCATICRCQLPVPSTESSAATAAGFETWAADRIPIPIDWPSTPNSICRICSAKSANIYCILALSSSRAGSRPAGLPGLAMKLCASRICGVFPLPRLLPNLILNEGRVTSDEWLKPFTHDMDSVHRSFFLVTLALFSLASSVQVIKVI